MLVIEVKLEELLVLLHRVFEHLFLNFMFLVHLSLLPSLEILTLLFRVLAEIQACIICGIYTFFVVSELRLSDVLLFGGLTLIAVSERTFPSLSVEALVKAGHCC